MHLYLIQCSIYLFGGNNSKIQLVIHMTVIIWYEKDANNYIYAFQHEHLILKDRCFWLFKCYRYIYLSRWVPDLITIYKLFLFVPYCIAFTKNKDTHLWAVNQFYLIISFRRLILAEFLRFGWQGYENDVWHFFCDIV